MTDRQSSSGFTTPAAPPLRTRMTLAMAHLGWPDTAMAAAIEAINAAPHEGTTTWFARLNGTGNASQDGVESGVLELWNDAGAWLSVGALGTRSGSRTASVAALTVADVAPVLARSQVLPGWLQDATPRWVVHAPNLAVVHYDLPGDSARERMQAAQTVMRGGLDSPAAAALSTCPAQHIGLELRSDRSAHLLVETPPPRVAAWVLGDDSGSLAERVAFVLAARGIQGLHVDHLGNALASWRLA